MTALLSWHVQNCDLIGSLKPKLEWKEFPQDFKYELINPLPNVPYGVTSSVLTWSVNVYQPQVQTSVPPGWQVPSYLWIHHPTTHYFWYQKQVDADNLTKTNTYSGHFLIMKLVLNELTQWGPNKLVDTLNMAYSSDFFQNEIAIFLIKIHRSLLQRI